MKNENQKGKKMISGGLVLIIIVISIIVIGVIISLTSGSMSIGEVLYLFIPITVTTIYFVVNHRIRGQICHPIFTGIATSFLFSLLFSFIHFASTSGDAQWLAIRDLMILTPAWTILGLIAGVIYSAVWKSNSGSKKKEEQDETFPSYDKLPR